MNKQLSTKIWLVSLVMTVLAVPATYSQKSTKLFVEKPSSPIVITQKQVYRPGEYVSIAGSGFLPFERISLTLSEVDTQTRVAVKVEYLDAGANGRGGMSSEWRIREGVVPGTEFLLVARGMTSGKLAKTKFTSRSSLVPTPIIVGGNASCASLNANNVFFPHITSDWGFKLDNGTPNGTFPFVNSPGLPTELTGGASAEPSNSVTISVPGSGSEVTSWSSTRPITAVIMKYGASAIVYPYNPDSQGPDGPLPTNAQQAISHVEFCFQPPQADAKLIIVKRAAPPTELLGFGFTTTGVINSSFTLVDDNEDGIVNGQAGGDPAFDPMQMFTTTNFGSVTITEAAASPYSLRNISCTIDFAGVPAATTSINLPARSVTVDLTLESQVTCTFENDIVTAAAVSVSGRVTTRDGVGIPRATVIVTDAGGVNRIALTNQFGYYRVDQVEAGGAIFATVRKKGHTFSSTFLDVNEDVTGLDFEAQ